MGRTEKAPGIPAVLYRTCRYVALPIQFRAFRHLVDSYNTENWTAKLEEWGWKERFLIRRESKRKWNINYGRTFS